ncbi:MAG TPA: hypothetical protein VN737_00795 [Bryobacteraceae bacterium]|nr:hypothetical protein [Bryobacteraceae bacterium]
MRTILPAIWFIMTQSSKERRGMRPGERETLARFAQLKIPLGELRARLGDMLEIDFGPTERRLTSYFLLPNPGIRIGMEHITNALNKHWSGEITDQELNDWATMLLLNEAYEWSGPDEDEIAEMLNELSMRKASEKGEAE